MIIGDSNRSQWATMMKLATTHLVLCVIEQAGREGREWDSRGSRSRTLVPQTVRSVAI